MPQSRAIKNEATHLEILYADHDRDELSKEDAATFAAPVAIESVDLNRERLVLA